MCLEVFLVAVINPLVCQYLYWKEPGSCLCFWKIRCFFYKTDLNGWCWEIVEVKIDEVCCFVRLGICMRDRLIKPMEECETRRLRRWDGKLVLSCCCRVLSSSLSSCTSALSNATTSRILYDGTYTCLNGERPPDWNSGLCTTIFLERHPFTISSIKAACSVVLVWLQSKGNKSSRWRSCGRILCRCHPLVPETVAWHLWPQTVRQNISNKAAGIDRTDRQN